RFRTAARYLLGLAIAAAVLAALFMVVRRAPRRSSFGPIDIVPIAGLAAARTLAVIWLGGGYTQLRPCRLGNDLACAKIATRLIETAEHAPSAPPRLGRRALRACSTPISARRPRRVSAARGATPSAPSRCAPAGSTPRNSRSARPATSSRDGARAPPRNRRCRGHRPSEIGWSAARGPDGETGRYSPLRRGSSRSRRASPTRLNARTATMIASPENVVIHGQHLMYWRPSLRMFPQLGVGGGIPSPRNDRPASVRMAVAM